MEFKGNVLWLWALVTIAILVLGLTFLKAIALGKKYGAIYPLTSNNNPSDKKLSGLHVVSFPSSVMRGKLIGS